MEIFVIYNGVTGEEDVTRGGEGLKQPSEVCRCTLLIKQNTFGEKKGIGLYGGPPYTGECENTKSEERQRRDREKRETDREGVISRFRERRSGVGRHLASISGVVQSLKRSPRQGRKSFRLHEGKGGGKKTSAQGGFFIAQRGNESDGGACKQKRNPRDRPKKGLGRVLFMREKPIF